MQTKKQQYAWEPCINVGGESTVDIEAEQNCSLEFALVELTREDLESMLSALDEREGN